LIFVDLNLADLYFRMK